MSVIKSKQIYSVQAYCDDFLGFCPITTGERDELRKILDKEGYPELWDYAFDEIEHVVENDIPVVLVDTTYVNSESEMVRELRWFQIPFVFDYIERTADKEVLYDYLSNEALEEINGILEAYFEERIDIVEPRTEDGEPDYDGEFELIINDESYEKTGNEMLVLKWIEDYEDTGYLVECFNLM